MEPANIYVVRIWWETSREVRPEVRKVWRARATDAATKEERHFTSPDALARFLGLEEVPVTKARPLILATEGELLLAGGLGATLKLPGGATGDHYAVLEHSLEPGSVGAPLHCHSREDEVSYVLEGELTVHLGDQILTTPPGSFVRKPRGQFHTFWNAGNVPVSFLEIISPGGFERYFAELGALLAGDAPPNMEAITALAERYGLEFDLPGFPALLERHGLRLP